MEPAAKHERHRRVLCCRSATSSRIWAEKRYLKSSRFHSTSTTVQWAMTAEARAKPHSLVHSLHGSLLVASPLQRSPQVTRWSARPDPCPASEVTLWRVWSSATVKAKWITGLYMGSFATNPTRWTLIDLRPPPPFVSDAECRFLFPPLLVDSAAVSARCGHRHGNQAAEQRTCGIPPSQGRESMPGLSGSSDEMRQQEAGVLVLRKNRRQVRGQRPHRHVSVRYPS